MNLIKQLGGYEKSKYALALECKLPSPNTRYMIELQDCLFQYRRENNIYEVGDDVVVRKDSYIDLYSFNYMRIHKVVGVKDNFVSLDSFPKNTFVIRHAVSHATPEEIKAGHRL